MALLVGVDGCPGGWVVVSKDTETGGVGLNILAHFNEIAGNPRLPDVIAIDIPIGLNEIGTRECDRQARQSLGSRACTVFSAPLRPALNAATREDASTIRFDREGKKVGCQSFAIYQKIREIDSALQESQILRERTFEMHPEVSFSCLNGGRPIPERKKSANGRAKRSQLIASHFGADAFDLVRSQIPRREAKDDDILDAFAALWTAERIHEGTAERIPANPIEDSLGLPMCIWS